MDGMFALRSAWTRCRRNVVGLSDLFVIETVFSAHFGLRGPGLGAERVSRTPRDTDYCIESVRVRAQTPRATQRCLTNPRV